MDDETRRRPHITALIASAPWREAVTDRDNLAQRSGCPKAG